MDPLWMPLNSLAFFWAQKHITYNENLMAYPLISSSLPQEISKQLNPNRQIIKTVMYSTACI